MKLDKYPKKSPEGVFRVAVERSVEHDTREQMHYEYTYTVETVPTGCDFLDLFASLIMRRGNVPAKQYATRLGVTEKQLTGTLAALSGANFRDWTDAFAGAVAETLLRETNWPIARIARATRMSSSRAFNYFFLRRYKCTPQEWRWANR